jgi:sulfate permease, SulP family
VRGRIHEAIDGAPARVKWLFDAEGLGQIDATGVATLEELIGSLSKHGISFVVARLKGPLRDAFRAAGFTDTIGSEHFFPTIRDAVASFRSPEASPATNGTTIAEP